MGATVLQIVHKRFYPSVKKSNVCIRWVCSGDLATNGGEERCNHHQRAAAATSWLHALSDLQNELRGSCVKRDFCHFNLRTKVVGANLLKHSDERRPLSCGRSKRKLHRATVGFKTPHPHIHRGAGDSWTSSQKRPWHENTSRVKTIGYTRAPGDSVAHLAKCAPLQIRRHLRSLHRHTSRNYESRR